MSEWRVLASSTSSSGDSGVHWGHDGVAVLWYHGGGSSSMVERERDDGEWCWCASVCVSV